MRLPIFFALTLASCGLVPSSEAILPFPSDGTFGFDDAAPIEVCLGAARIVPPGAPSGAVCVAEAATAKACSLDGECAGIERCVCGRCVVEACQGGGSCGEGRVCRDKRCTTSCTTDSACPDGEVCAAGGCARACAGDADCHFGERCDSLGSTCRAKPCSTSTPCGKGARCEQASIEGELHEPSVADGDIAYVELRSGASRAIYRAIIEAEGRWTVSPIEPVLLDAGAPSALSLDDRVELYFELGDGEGIGRAVSTDGGLTFVKDASPWLTPAVAWEAGRVASPSVVRYRDSTYLFYEGGRRAGIGLARVGEGVATRASDEPIMTREAVSRASFWHDITEIGAPSAVISGDVLRVYFTARGIEGTDALIGDTRAPADANDSIGLFATTDGEAFSPSPTGPVLARLTNLRTYLGEREASVRAGGDGGFEITFVTADASGASPRGLAGARTSRSGNSP